MKRQHMYAAVFALAATAVWVAEALWLRRALARTAEARTS